jgi:hypothetical protein
MTKLTGAALDRAVAHAMGLKSVNNCEQWGKTMDETQPAQEPVAWGVFEDNNLHDMLFTQEEAQELARYKGSHAEVRPLYTTPLKREWNFCERCGKRTKDLTVIHTCTPPQEGT